MPIDKGRNGDSDTQKNTNVYTITRYSFIRLKLPQFIWQQLPEQR